MIRTINPYASARTAEIMSRYRPIAPKPETQPGENENINSGVEKSPYLRSVWARLQARPTRTWKRGRSAAFGPPISSVKRRRTCFQGPSLPYQCTNSPVAKTFAMHGIFAHGLPPQISLSPVKCSLDAAVTTLAETVALPFLYHTTAAKESVTKVIDLNIKADQAPQELDFLPQLQSPVKPRVISPRPVRPVGSSIIVKNIIIGNPSQQTMTAPPEDVVEAEELPAIVSDSNNKVRMSNSAYKKMVGQPECGWLDCAGGGGGGDGCRRIGGEVSISFSESEPRLLDYGHGFCCRVKIEWESEGERIRKCVEASGEVVKLVCEGKDYQLLWRFHTTEKCL